MLMETAYGTVSTGDDGSEVSAEFGQLYSWATRPGTAWPGSELRYLDSISAKFDAKGDLVDLSGAFDGLPADPLEVPGDELNAWVSDVLRDADLADHPAMRS